MYNIVTFLPKFFFNILHLRHIINTNNYVMSKPFIRFRIKNPAICGKLNWDCISDGLTEEDNKFLLALYSKAKMIKR